MKRLAVLLVLISCPLFADDFIIDEPAHYTQSSSSAQAAMPVSPPPPPPQRLQPAPVAPHNPPVAIGSVPTTDSLRKGRYLIEFTMYDTGGVNTRMIVGIFDVLAIGISENFDGLIGSGDISVNIPGAYVKLNILKDLYNFNWALGFDSFATGKNGSWFDTNNRPSTIYGFYTCVGFRYNLFGYTDMATFGYRIPLLPNEVREITNSSFMLAAAATVSPYFRFGMTVENIYADFTRSDRILPSAVVTFMPNSQFNLSLSIQYEFYSSRVNRILSIGYESGF